MCAYHMNKNGDRVFPRFKYTNAKKKIITAKCLMGLLRDQLEIKNELNYLGFSEFRTSYIFRFRIYIGSAKKKYREILVKVSKREKSEDIPYNPSKNEYRFLKQLNYLLSDIPWIIIPKPIMMLPEQNGFAMEVVDGTDLQKLTSLYGCRFSSEKGRLKTYFKNLGKAMGLIQARTYSQNGDRAKLYMSMKLDSIQRQIVSMPKIYLKYVKRALKCINEAISTISWGKAGIVWTHGDCVHSNILITKQERVGIFDFANSRFDSPYYDISRFTLRTLITHHFGLNILLPICMN